MAYNQDIVRLVADYVQEEIKKAISAHEAKEATDDFVNSHKPTV